MKKKLVLVLAFAINVGIHAQVTIGSSAKPVTGALLDLKEFGSSADKSTATKGLLLPRVAIADPTILQIAPETQKEEHVGTIVYAVPDEPDESTVAADPCTSIPIVVSNVSGLMVWTGTEWVPLMAKEEEENESGPSLPSWVHPAVKLTQPDHEGNSYTYRYFGNPDHQYITLDEFISAGGIASDYKNFGYWMTENLRSTEYGSNYPGKKLSLVKSSGGKKEDLLYGYPRQVREGKDVDIDMRVDKDFRDYPILGLLYSAGAIAGAVDGTIAITPDMQGICPDGWLLPKKSDWDNLIAYLTTPEQVALYTTYDKHTPVVDQYNTRTLVTECNKFMTKTEVEYARGKTSREGAFGLIAVGWGKVTTGAIFNDKIFEYPETIDTGSSKEVNYRAGSAASNATNTSFYHFSSQSRPLQEQMISVRCRRDTNPSL